MFTHTFTWAQSIERSCLHQGEIRGTWPQDVCVYIYRCQGYACNDLQSQSVSGKDTRSEYIGTVNAVTCQIYIRLSKRRRKFIWYGGTKLFLCRIFFPFGSLRTTKWTYHQNESRFSWKTLLGYYLSRWDKLNTSTVTDQFNSTSEVKEMRIRRGFITWKGWSNRNKVGPVLQSWFERFFLGHSGCSTGFL